jgi:hypothetical protein
MIVDLNYQLILSTIQTIGILVGIFYYIMTLQNTRKNQQMQLETRQAQLFMQIYSELYDVNSLSTWTETVNILHKLSGYDEWYQKFVLDPKGKAKFNSMVIYLEGIGVLVKRKLIDPAYVDDLISSTILGFWDGVKGFIYEYRRRTGDYDYCEWVEYLAEEIRLLRAKRDERRKPIES